MNPVLSQWLSGPADPIHYHADPPVVFKGASEHLDLAVRSTLRPLVGPARTRFRSRLAESHPKRQLAVTPPVSSSQAPSRHA